LGLLLALIPVLPQAQDPNLCDEAGEEPDVIVGDLHQVNRPSPGTPRVAGTTHCQGHSRQRGVRGRGGEVHVLDPELQRAVIQSAMQK